MNRLRNRIRAFFVKYQESSIVFKASIWFVVVSVIDKAVSLITQPFINRILSVEEVGVCHNFNAWLSIMLIFSTLNLFCGSLEILITNNKNESKKISASLSICSTLCAFVFWGICAVFIGYISSWLELKPIYILFMALSTWASAIIQYWCVPKRFEYNYKKYSIVTLVLFVSRAVLSVLLVYFCTFDRVLGRIMGLCLPQVIVALFLLPSILKNLEIKKITRYWKKAIILSLPLIPHYLATFMLSSSDRIMIIKLSGEAENGLYSVAYSFSSLTLMVFTAINSAYSPFAYSAIRDKNYTILRKKTNSLLLVSVLFALLIIFLAPEGLYILGGEKYLVSLNIVPVLVVGIFLSSSYFIFSNIEYVKEKTKYVFPITAAGAIVNIALNWLLIPKFGYQAAAYTTFIGYLIIAVLHYCVAKKIAGQNIYDMKYICLLFAAFVTLAAVALVLYQLPWIVRYIVSLILLGISIYLYKSGKIKIK